MRTVIFGSRDFTNTALLNKALDQLHEVYKFSLVIDGVARGVDTLAHNWAVRNCIPTAREPAQWNKYGKAAGPIRNELMITKYHPELAIAFPGGNGTRHMTGLCHEYGLLVKTVRPR